MLTGRKYRLAFAPEQAEFAETIGGICRSVWNTALNRACREHGTFRVQWRSSRRWSPLFRSPAGKQVAVERLGRKWGRCTLPKFG